MIHTRKQLTSLPVHFIRTCNANGTPCFFVLRASNASFMKLKAKMGKDPIDISTYGEIIASGFGDKPHKALAKRLHDEYDIEIPA